MSDNRISMATVLNDFICQKMQKIHAEIGAGLKDMMPATPKFLEDRVATRNAKMKEVDAMIKAREGRENGVSQR